MSDLLYDTRMPGVRTAWGEWSLGVPCGLFWLPSASELTKEPGTAVDYEFARPEILPGLAPHMVWLVAAGCPRGHLTLEVLDGEVPKVSSRCDPDYVPCGLTAERGGDLRPVGPIAEPRVRVHYCGPDVPGKALVRPIILFTEG